MNDFTEQDIAIDENFTQWLQENAQRDPLLHMALQVKERDQLTDIEFYRMLIFWYQKSLKASQEAFLEHMKKCAAPTINFMM